MPLKEQIMEVIGGPHVAAVATLDGKLPAVRFMVLPGFPDMTLVGATMKASNKVGQLKKNPDTALAIWSGKEYSDPYVDIRAKGRSTRMWRPRRDTGTRCSSSSSKHRKIRILSCSCSLQARSRTTGRICQAWKSGNAETFPAFLIIQTADPSYPATAGRMVLGKN